MRRTSRAMNRKAEILRDASGPLCAAAILAASLQSACGQETKTAWDKYLWQTARCSAIAPSTSNLVQELQGELEKILEAGPLAPIRTVYAELEDDQRAPWTSKGFIPPDQGSRRELHSFHEPRGWDRYWAMWGCNKPLM